MGKSTAAVMRFWPSGAALLGAIAVGAAMAPAPAAAQGLFDFLFSGAPQYERAPVSYAPDPGFNVRTERPRQKRGKRSPAIEAVVGEKPVKTAPPAVGAGPLGRFVNDSTLRAGDVVVTSEGLMVYRGGGGTHHSSKEFVGIAQAGTVIGGNRATLTSIDKANRIGVVPEQVAEANL